LNNHSLELFFMTPIKFEGRNAEFFATLRNRINEYFTDNNIKPTGNWRLYLKTIVLFTLLIGNYTALYLIPTDSAWIYLAFGTMGLWFAGIGFNVMHDGAHGSYSSKHWVNQLMAKSLNLLGGNSFLWAEKHNVVHHSFTNIEGVDDDIDLWPLLRINNSRPRYWFHKYQHIYGLLLYFVAYFAWVLMQDFKKYFSGKVIDRPFKSAFTLKDHFWFWASKITYLGIFLVIPIYVLGAQTAILGFLTTGFVTGICITIVFQLAHVVEDIHFVTDKADAEMAQVELDAIRVPDDWATHQINTTSNFSTKSAFLTWALGGLNFQVEHHLFPKISHIHYPKINEIVKKTCADFNVKYNEIPSFFAAVRSHLMHLKAYGQLA
jgi:linoleoyl-CoA desaturase